MAAPPPALAAAFAALRFQGADAGGLRNLNDAAWNRLLSICDRTQLTLALAAVCGEGRAPGWALERMRLAALQTRRRNELVWNSYLEIAAALERERIQFAVLKGFAGEPEFVRDARLRVQYDLDFFVPPESAARAYGCIRGLGYAPATAVENLPTDHLPVLVRQTGWSWTGDYFDPAIPLSIDVHFRLWDRETERFDAPGWDRFWNRRIEKWREGARVPAFSAPDSLAYHCLHLLRHLLRGDLRFGHVHELAYSLHRSSDDAEFWAAWSAAHDPALRRLQAVCFGLAERWFACSLAPPAAEAAASLSEGARDWLRRYPFAPAHAALEPNKHELWLHLELLEKGQARIRVLRRRLFPSPRLGPSGAIFVPAAERTLALRFRHAARLLGHRAARVWHHARTLPAAFVHGAARWWRFRAANKSTRSASNTVPR